MDGDTKLDRSLPTAAVVYNPVNVPVPALRAAVAAAEREPGWGSSHWFETGRDEGGSAATRKAIAVSPGVVLAAGGDGTVRAVAEELHGSIATPPLDFLGRDRTLHAQVRITSDQKTPATATQLLRSFDELVDPLLAVKPRGEQDDRVLEVSGPLALPSLHVDASAGNDQ